MGITSNVAQLNTLYSGYKNYIYKSHLVTRFKNINIYCKNTKQFHLHSQQHAFPLNINKFRRIAKIKSQLRVNTTTQKQQQLFNDEIKYANMRHLAAFMH